MGKAKKSSLAEDKSSSISSKNSIPSVNLSLAALFDSSVPRPPLSVSKAPKQQSQYAFPKDEILGELSELSHDEVAISSESEVQQEGTVIELSKSKKRKRGHQEDDIEGKYLQKLARAEALEIAAQKKQKKEAIQDEGLVIEDDGEAGIDEDHASEVEIGLEAEQDNEDYVIPQHESLTTNGTADELEKATRTVFLGNVTTEAIKSKSAEKTLLKHLASIFADMKDASEQNIESIRYRSTAFSDGSLPKKAAYVKKELMDATTKGTNAYAVYSTPAAAREAVKKLNSTIVLGRHLRVDSVAHPSAVDHRRCVFVGNLGFVDDESNIRALQAREGQRPHAKIAADIEEGLWIHFGKAGAVESVRVVRDRGTRVGKGFAYVQFKDPNSVEKALLFNEKKFPPMLPRKLRVVRARKVKKAAISKAKQSTNGDDIYRPKPSAQLSSLAGRAGKLLGRAGGHQVRKSAKQGDLAFKSPESIIFEGHRAVPGGGPKLHKEHKKTKRPPRRTSRSTAYRARSSKT